MARLTDPGKLACYKAALANWRYTDYVIYSDLALAWLSKERHSEKDFARELSDYVRAGGEIDEVAERRPEWSAYSHHYDLRPTVARRRLYVETRLLCDDLTDLEEATIAVVNIHDA